MRKVGHRIFGSGYGYDPQLPKFLKKKFNWMLRALHATFLIEDTAYRRPLAMPIWFEVLIAKLKRGKDLTKAEMKFLDSVEQADALVAKSIEMVHFIRKTLDESGHAHQTLRLFADNSFSNGNFMKSLPHNTVYVGRFKRNGGLYLPLKEKRGKTIYGDPLPKPHMLFADPQFRISQAKFYYGGGWSEFSFKDINNIYWKGGTNQQLVRLLLLLADSSTAYSRCQVVIQPTCLLDYHRPDHFQPGVDPGIPQSMADRSDASRVETRRSGCWRDAGVDRAIRSEGLPWCFSADVWPRQPRRPPMLKSQKVGTFLRFPFGAATAFPAALGKDSYHHAS